jgi:sterol desaturase/sphingolipid hydroxylase (fatty acid hydroxylase superfamily)
MYVWHRLNHRVPWLWRFHLVHHTDLDLDVSTALRFSRR